MRLILSAAALLGAAVSLSAMQEMPVSEHVILSDAYPAKLSDFGFFDGGADRPSDGLIPYALNTPLFSDYAEKQRFIHLPKSDMVRVSSADGRLKFPVGTALIKSFGYRAASGVGLDIIETRLLLRRAGGWVALPYVWRPDGRDADLRVGGTRVPVEFMTPSGAHKKIDYAVPNKNQCKQCHSAKHDIQPIGPILGNMKFPTDGDKNRLLARIDGKVGDYAKWAIWDDEHEDLNARAGSYLRGNCGHCHNPNGSASNSGLFYDGNDYGAANGGMFKRPVAAGRGSGNLDFVIAPGHADKSILIFRMKSLDPGIAMPELGRSTVHEEGVVLLERWINEMPQQ